MLVLSRKEGQKIVIPELGIEIQVCRILDDKVKLGITAPKTVRVNRKEVQDAINDGRANVTSLPKPRG